MLGPIGVGSSHDFPALLGSSQVERLLASELVSIFDHVWLE